MQHLSCSPLTVFTQCWWAFETGYNCGFPIFCWFKDASRHKALPFAASHITSISDVYSVLLTLLWHSNCQYKCCLGAHEKLSPKKLFVCISVVHRWFSNHLIFQNSNSLLLEGLDNLISSIRYLKHIFVCFQIFNPEKMCTLTSLTN